MRVADLVLIVCLAVQARAKNEHLQAVPDLQSLNTAQAVTVCMDYFAPGGAIYMAESEAAEIFSRISVPIIWKSGRECQSGNAVHIRVSEHTPEELLPGALAFALPYKGDAIEIFYDRVRAMAGPRLSQRLLAYVVAHELGHILECETRHSETGIMKAFWGEKDYWAMWSLGLNFASEDVNLIQSSIRSRSQWLDRGNSLSVQ